MSQKLDDKVVMMQENDENQQEPDTSTEKAPAVLSIEEQYDLGKQMMKEAKRRKREERKEQINEWCGSKKKTIVKVGIAATIAVGTGIAVWKILTGEDASEEGEIVGEVLNETGEVIGQSSAVVEAAETTV